MALLSHNRPEYFEIELAAATLGVITACLNWRLSPREIAQITTVWTAKNELLNDARDFDVTKARKLYPNGIGHFARPQDEFSTLSIREPGP